MTESPVEQDRVRQFAEFVEATAAVFQNIAAFRQQLTAELDSIGVVQLPDMIRIRVKPNHITIRIGDTPKQRYASAIHALHVIRVAVKEGGAAIEDARKTQYALACCVKRARAELEAAISDVPLAQQTAVCTMHQTDDRGTETSLYQTTDRRHLKVVHHWRFEVWEDDQCIRCDGPEDSKYIVGSADDAIRALGYVIAPVGATV